MSSERELAGKTWPEAEALLKDGPVALLPIGSTEPHGPHLPLDTDVVISVEVSRRAAAGLANRGIRTLILPPIAYSITDFSKDFAGAVGITRATSTALVGDVCRAAIEQGCAAVCLVNSHLEPEHLAALREAANLVAAQTGRPVIFPDKTQRRWAAALTPEFRSGACHAGQYETSLLMAARPEQVREQIRSALTPNPISIGRKIKEGARTFREAGGPQAYFGDPRSATAAEGEASYEALAAMVQTAILEALA